MKINEHPKTEKGADPNSHCIYEDATGVQRNGRVMGDAGSSAMVLVTDNETGKTIEVPHYKVRVVG